MLEDKKVFIFGYSGHAYVIIESLIEMGYFIEGYFDFEEATVNPYGLTYYGFEKKVAVQEIVKNSLVFPTVGDNVIRKKLVHFFEELSLHQFTVIDKSANVSKTAQIGYSTYIGKNTAINAQAKIGNGVIVNTGAIIEHECHVNDFVHVAPASVLCGNVTVNKNVFIGANTVVKNNISIHEEVTIGAGAVVVKSIVEKGIWVGNPTRKYEIK